MSSNPYEAPSPESDRALPADSAAFDSGEARDAESDALITFGRRVSRVHMIATGIATVSTLIVGVPAYWGLRAIQLTANGAHWPVATGAIAFVVPGVILITLSRMIANGYVAARRNAWLDELAQTHGVSAESMRELVESVTAR